MTRAKVQAGGILRKSADTTWKTPEWLLARARVLVGDPIPFDPFTALNNPTQALLYCAGPPGRLFGTAGSLKCDLCVPTHRDDPTDASCARCDMARRNGLEVDWLSDFWCNPPFTKEAIEKLAREAARVGRGLALLPCNRFEEPYLQDVLALASCVCFVDAKAFQLDLPRKGRRIAFISSQDEKPVEANPYASMVLGFGYSPESFAAAFSSPTKPMGASFKLAPIGARSSA